MVYTMCQQVETIIVADSITVILDFYPKYNDTQPDFLVIFLKSDYLEFTMLLVGKICWWNCKLNKPPSDCYHTVSAGFSVSLSKEFAVQGNFKANQMTMKGTLFQTWHEIRKPKFETRKSDDIFHSSKQWYLDLSENDWWLLKIPTEIPQRSHWEIISVMFHYALQQTTFCSDAA